MNNYKYESELLLKYIRDGLIEEEHFGNVVLVNKEEKILEIGKENSYQFFQRSCAKPLFATLMIDYETDKYYNLALEEIAICASSHSGDIYHLEILKNLLSKIKLDEKYLKCYIHDPISIEEKKRLIKEEKLPSVLHNNCSGKHLLYLGICKQKNWDLLTYNQINHPLQIRLKNKIIELCNLKKKPKITKDGCTVPIFATTLSQLAQGFLNVFTDSKYKKILNAYKNYPKLIGGNSRLDTLIMENCDNLIAKNGASGLCTIANISKEQCLVIKMTTSDQKARAIVALELLYQLGWINLQKFIELKKISIFDFDIKILNGEKVGEITPTFKI